MNCFYWLKMAIFNSRGFFAEYGANALRASKKYCFKHPLRKGVFMARSNINKLFSLVGTCTIIFHWGGAIAATNNLIPADNIKEAKLKITNHQHREYCVDLKVEHPVITPEALVSNGSYLFLKTCNDARALWSYDVNGRISTLQNGLDYCITLPDKVSSWDYLRIKRCDISNKNQQWFTKKEHGDKYFVSMVGNYRIKDTNNYLYVSNKTTDLYDHTLTSSMNKWLQNFSKPRSYNFSTGMHWLYQQNPYYANYRADAYMVFKESIDDSEDVLYSPIKKTIAVQQLNGVNESRSYCLNSKQSAKESVWRYVSLHSQCPEVDDEGAVPKSMQWDMVLVDLPADKNLPAKVKFYDYLGNSLKVWSDATQSGWGFAYTAPNNALPSYENILTKSKDVFYVNRSLALFWLFQSANEQKRVQFCPSHSIDPNQKQTSHDRVIRSLPPGFQVTDAWYDKFQKIALTKSDSSEAIAGICGPCTLQALEIIRELIETDAAAPEAGGHYFDPSNEHTAISQFSTRFPQLFAEQNLLASQARADITQLGQLLTQGRISGGQYRDDFRRITVDAQQNTMLGMLPDGYQVTQPSGITGIRFSGYDNLTTEAINTALTNSPVGTIVLLTSNLSLLSGSTVAHGSPLVRFADGWVVLETAGSTADRVQLFNHHRSQTPADAVFYYYQTRRPYVTASSVNNINFQDPFSYLSIFSINRPNITNMFLSLTFGNCTGEGEDGRRGSGEVEGTSVQNLCQHGEGALGRCFGGSTSQ